jgi:hypothetical protein
LQKQETEEYTMRLVLLAAAATFVLTGTAMADESAPAHVRASHHHHYREANASVPAVAAVDAAAPADTMSAHDAHMKNLRDSGYDPAGDRTAAGNLKAN